MSATTTAQTFSHTAFALCNPISRRGPVVGERVHNRAGNFFCNYRRPAGHRSIAAAAVVYLFSTAAALLSSCTPVYAGHQHLESWYADALAAETGARSEVRMRDGTRCDVLTATHAVEVEFAAKWCEAVGQSLNYASQTGKPGAIALILEREGDGRFLQRLRTLIAWHDLPLSVVVMRPFSKDGLEFENLNAVSHAKTQRRKGEK